MGQYAEFVTNHWVLTGAWIALASLLIASFFQGRGRGISSLGPTAVTQLINHENAVVLDIREQNVFVGGHILGALNIPLKGLAQRLDGEDLEEYKVRPVVICCQEGVTAKKAAPLLQQAGFEKLYLLQGGVSEWRNANLPLSRGRKK
jgi:rhodanese-related sulfurtransferase